MLRSMQNASSRASGRSRRSLRIPFRAFDAVCRAVTTYVESLLTDTERRYGLWKSWTVSATRFTAGDNRGWWNSHDWSCLGEEWTPDPTWKASVLNRFLLPFVPPGGRVLEIGPGGGRWTEVLIARAARVYVLDVAEVPLRVCRHRFSRLSTVTYVRGDGRTVPLVERSIDAIWAYDVFVHVNPHDARSYVTEFGRVLRRGGHAVLHHPGHELTTGERALQHRSDLTDLMINEFARGSGFEIVLQTRELVNEGDALTVLRKK